MTALLKSQENIAAHDNGDMADDTVEIPQLGLPLEVEIMRHHLAEYLDILPLAVNTDDSSSARSILIERMASTGVCGGNGQRRS